MTTYYQCFWQPLEQFILFSILSLLIEIGEGKRVILRGLKGLLDEIGQNLQKTPQEEEYKALSCLLFCDLLQPFH